MASDHSSKPNPIWGFGFFLLLILQLIHTIAIEAAASNSMEDEVADSKVLVNRGGAEQREFDYFVLALEWPGTFCSNPGRCCPSNGCCRGSDSPTEFTIHGLWPQYNQKGWPSCCSEKEFDENEIFTLTEDLEKYWPSLMCSKPSTCRGTKGSFWGHEWEKHGTCAAPIIVGEYDYFLTTLTIFSKHNVTKYLNDAGIVASATQKYPIEDVVAAIKDGFGATPKLSCAKKGAVKELWICFDKNFEPRDCETRKSCPDLVKFPTYEPLEINSVEGAIAIAMMIDADEAI